jgi:hypothetical protein
MVSKMQPSIREIKFDKPGRLSDTDLEIVTTAMRLANTLADQVWFDIGSLMTGH